MQLASGLKPAPGSNTQSRSLSTAPMTSSKVQPVTQSGGTYGGPSGSYITKSKSCPPSYYREKLSGGDYRCIPLPSPVSAAAPASTNITVSPAFQQSFTPQFSPALLQQQDSPGATQAASPTQIATPSQEATSAIPPVAASPQISPAAPYPAEVPAYVPANVTAPLQTEETATVSETGIDKYLIPLLIGGGILLLLSNQRQQNYQPRSQR